MSAHAFLSPSSAHRWLACTPSAHFESNFPDNAGEAAKEGTVAHSLGDCLIKQALNMVSRKKIKYDIEKIKLNRFYNADMLRHCEGYRDYVLERYAEALAVDPKAKIYIEERLNMSRWVPKGFGRGDVIILCKKYLEFIDLKYGQGVPVSAVENKQLYLYALGAYDAHDLIYEFKYIRMTIYQPRLDSITTDTKTILQLLDWADQVLVPKALLAFKGEGEYVPGDHCKFCRGKADCEALAKFNLELTRHAFKTSNFLSPEAKAEAIRQGPLLVDWVNSLKDSALKDALDGDVLPGYKLVHGKSSRMYKDTEKVAAAVLEKGYKEDELYKKDLIGITAMEKLIGKNGVEEILKDLIIKPAGAPTLVPESDPRPVYRSSVSVFSDGFKDEQS